MWTIFKIEEMLRKSHDFYVELKQLNYSITLDDSASNDVSYRLELYCPETIL